jgi:hypothetical protein
MKKLFIIGVLFPFLAFATANPDIKPNSPWEEVQAPHYNVGIERMSVPHGWLVITYAGTVGSTIFVPDENHEWTL